MSKRRCPRGSLRPTDSHFLPVLTDEQQFSLTRVPPPTRAWRSQLLELGASFFASSYSSKGGLVEKNERTRDVEHEHARV